MLALWTWVENKRRNGGNDGNDGDEGRGDKRECWTKECETALNLFLFWVSLPTEFGPVARGDRRDNPSKLAIYSFDTKTPKKLLYIQQPQWIINKHYHDARVHVHAIIQS